MFFAVPLMILLSTFDANNFVVEHCIQFDSLDTPHCFLEIGIEGRTSIQGVQKELDTLNAKGARGILGEFSVSAVNEGEYFDTRARSIGAYLFEVSGSTGTVSATGFPPGEVNPFVRKAKEPGLQRASRPGGELFDDFYGDSVTPPVQDIRETSPSRNMLRGDARLMSPDGDTLQCVVGSVAGMMLGALGGAATGAQSGTVPAEKAFWTAVGAVSGGVAGFLAGAQQNCPEDPKDPEAKEPAEKKEPASTDATPVTPAPDPAPAPSKDIDKKTPKPDAVVITQPAPVEASKPEGGAGGIYSEKIDHRPLDIHPDQNIILPREFLNTLRAMNAVRSPRRSRFGGGW